MPCPYKLSTYQYRPIRMLNIIEAIPTLRQLTIKKNRDNKMCKLIQELKISMYCHFLLTDYQSF